MRKPAYDICENNDAGQLRALVFATRIARSLYFQNPKFQASSHLLCMYSPVWPVSDLVGNPEDRFYHNESQISLTTTEAQDEAGCPLNR